MSDKRYTDEFKQEAIKQITERGQSVADVANPLGVTTHNLYAWLKKYSHGPFEWPPNSVKIASIIHRILALKFLNDCILVFHSYDEMLTLF